MGTGGSDACGQLLQPGPDGGQQVSSRRSWATVLRPHPFPRSMPVVSWIQAEMARPSSPAHIQTLLTTWEAEGRWRRAVPCLALRFKSSTSVRFRHTPATESLFLTSHASIVRDDHESLSKEDKDTAREVFTTVDMGIPSRHAYFMIPHADDSKTPRQAVVLIHGIGEQMPVATLRSFVMGLGYTDFNNKPDRFSPGFELRRMTLKKDVSRTPVDFFEFYWAHHLEHGQLRETLLWTAKLVARRPFWRHNAGLRGAIGVAQVTALLLVALVCWGLVSALVEGELSGVFKAWSSTLGVVSLILNFVAGGFITNSLADAPRYLTPAPSNIEGRNAIRAEGLALLRSLHESGDYQRIVIVGHSLGSVIGFDLIRLLWDEMRHPDPLQPSRLVEERTIEVAAAAARQATEVKHTDAWQKSQYRLWRECRSRGMTWLITDFITLGSPLAHGSFLLESNEWWRSRTGPTLSDRQHEQEVPTCPPDERCGNIFYDANYSDPAYGKRRTRVAHHAAPFAVTRWTNLYFPVKRFHGDPVGGPLAPEFGAGIRDIPVRTHPEKARTWAGLYLRAHVRYWRPDAAPVSSKAERDQIDEETGTYFAVGRLKDALGLKIEKARLKYPPADPVAAGWSSEVPAALPVIPSVTPEPAP